MNMKERPIRAGIEAESTRITASLHEECLLRHTKFIKQQRKSICRLCEMMLIFVTGVLIGGISAQFCVHWGFVGWEMHFVAAVVVCVILCNVIDLVPTLEMGMSLWAKRYISITMMVAMCLMVIFATIETVGLPIANTDARVQSDTKYLPMFWSVVGLAVSIQAYILETFRWWSQGFIKRSSCAAQREFMGTWELEE